MIFKYQTTKTKPELVFLHRQLCYGLCLVENLSGQSYQCRDTSLTPVQDITGIHFKQENSDDKSIEIS
jgi:hypothetical protein